MPWVRPGHLVEVVRILWVKLLTQCLTKSKSNSRGVVFFKTAYGENTEQALAAGVLGASSYVLDDELNWGRDRLDFLDRVLGDSR